MRGGHTHTVTIDEGGTPVPIDTGFMVFNRVTYPCLVRLFQALEVPVRRTDMGFSVQHVPRGLEFSGSSLNLLFGQRRNLLRPSFYRMLAQIDRFNREAVAALEDPSVEGMSLADYVARGAYGEDFLNLYLVPMSSAVWTTPPDRILAFPAATLLRFFHNHGFLGLHTQHPWWTVEGGAKTYVERLTAPFRDRIRLRTPATGVRRIAGGGVEVAAGGGVARFDKVILACHPPASLSLLGDGATPDERRLLAPFQYQPNIATLHIDATVMPRTRRTWSAWNYRLDAPEHGVSTHYWMNRLQDVSNSVNYFVSINAGRLVAPERVIRTIEYEHPIFDLACIRAQADIPALNDAAQGGTETYFAGAWQRYGFHEDGLLSAVNLSERLLGRDPWGGTG